MAGRMAGPLTLDWHKSSRSNSGNCAEVRSHGSQVQVRDSKLGEASPQLAFTPAAWAAFLVCIQEGSSDGGG